MSAGPVAVRVLPAFVRRDLMSMLSHRFALVGDWVGLLVQVAIFSFVERLVDPSAMPMSGNIRLSYLEFTAAGIAVASLLQLGLRGLVGALRQEQLTGTLEGVLVSPASLREFQVGSVAFDILYVPLRTLALLALVQALFDVRYDVVAATLPLLVLIVLFLPVVWGLGLLTAAAVVAWKRGQAAVALVTTVLTVASGAYFPLTLFPEPIARALGANPVTVMLEAVRATLVSGDVWGPVGQAAPVLAALALVVVPAGTVVFRAAIRRELATGNLGAY